MLVEIRGEAFDLTSFAPYHEPGSAVIPLVRSPTLNSHPHVLIPAFTPCRKRLRSTVVSTLLPSSPSGSVGRRLQIDGF